MQPSPASVCLSAGTGKQARTNQHLARSAASGGSISCSQALIRSPQMPIRPSLRSNTRASSARRCAHPTAALASTSHTTKAAVSAPPEAPLACQHVR